MSAQPQLFREAHAGFWTDRPIRLGVFFEVYVTSVHMFRSSSHVYVTRPAFSVESRSEDECLLEAVAPLRARKPHLIKQLFPAKMTSTVKPFIMKGNPVGGSCCSGLHSFLKRVLN